MAGAPADGSPLSAAAAPNEDAGADTAADDGSGGRLRKRTVALHIGYVGTDFSGLQANRDMPQQATVEGVLERALFEAGMISEANYGDFRKTKWARSSRTDKGVHSLCTVISVRLLLQDTLFEVDPEGIAFARMVNAHLPASVRVLSVQRTTKKFNVRRWCLTRTYEYYLPSATLGLASPDGTGPGDAERLALFRAALQQYVGQRPFHNFAGDRKQYVKSDRGSRAMVEKWAAQQAERRQLREGAAGAGAGAGAAAEAEDGAAAEAEAVAGAPADGGGSASDAVGDADASGSEADDVEQNRAKGGGADGAAAEAGAGEREWVQRMRFLDDPDPKDPVVMTHYRRISSFMAGDPRPLVEGGTPCLRLEVKGDSFMLNQIRNMIGAAVAVSQGRMSLDLLVVALSAPGRITVPKAPPHTLLLSDNEFSPFAKSWGEEIPLVAKYSGDALSLREGGRGEQRAFRQEVFDPALNGLLSHQDWEYWRDTTLPRYNYPADEAADIIARHKAWLADLTARRAEAAAAKEAKAAAAAAAAAAAEAEAGAQAEAAAAQVGDGWRQEQGQKGGGVLGAIAQFVGLQ